MLSRATVPDEERFVVLEHDVSGVIEVTEGEATREKVFDRNGVKGDLFHYFNSMKKTWKKSHGMYTTASGMLRDAFLPPQQDKLDEECNELIEVLVNNEQSRWYQNREGAEKEARHRMHCPAAKVLEDIERHVPEPAVLLERVKEVVLFVANVRCHKSGEPLFSKASWTCYAEWVKHIRRGCVSDKPGFDYYYYTPIRIGR
jgi:hypothetical protein